MLTDPCSSFTETKWSRKESSFPAEMPLIKLIGAAYLQAPVITRKFLPSCHRTTRLGCLLTNAIIVFCVCQKPVPHYLYSFYQRSCTKLRLQEKTDILPKWQFFQKKYFKWSFKPIREGADKRMYTVNFSGRFCYVFSSFLKWLFFNFSGLIHWGRTSFEFC